ncbi:MAG: SxtJ family membrane protein [Phycisphaerae bacterium]
MAVFSLDLNPPAKVLRSFGLIGLVAFPALAALAWRRWLAFAPLPDAAVAPTALSLLGLGVYCGLFSFAAPTALRPLFVIMSLVGYPIGLVVSYAAMGLIFYLIITPIAFIFRLIGRDALNRRFDPSMASYWIRRRPPASMKRYFRQF